MTDSGVLNIEPLLEKSRGGFRGFRSIVEA
jgi:hypothetical protein